MKQEIEGAYPTAKVVTVPGDIGDSATSTKVCIAPLHLFFNTDFVVVDCRGCGRCLWTDRYAPSHSLLIRSRNLMPELSDVLVSNAGICPFAEFLTMPHATWERTRQVNLDGTFYVTQGMPQTSWKLRRLTPVFQRLRNKWKSKRRKEAPSSEFRLSPHLWVARCNGMSEYPKQHGTGTHGNIATTRRPRLPSFP